MKRLPVLLSFVLFLALCVSLAYWALQLFKPAPRAVTAPPQAAAPEADLRAAAGLFGGRGAAAAVAGNFQLKGVVAAADGRDSVAILSVNGKPAQAVRQGAEIAPGATVKEVHRRYVMVSEGGVPKRLDLPESAPAATVMSNPAASPATRPPPSAPPPPSPPAPNPALPSGIQLGPAIPIQQAPQTGIPDTGSGLMPAQ